MANILPTLRFPKGHGFSHRSPLQRRRTEHAGRRAGRGAAGTLSLRCRGTGRGSAPLPTPRSAAPGRSSPQVRRPAELRPRVRSVAPRRPKHRTALAAPVDVAKTEEQQRTVPGAYGGHRALRVPVPARRGAEPPRREPQARQGTLRTSPSPGGPRRGVEPRTHRGAAGSNPQRRRSAPAPAGARCRAQTPSLGAHIQTPAAQLKVLLRSTRRAPPPPASDRCHLPSPRPPALRPPGGWQQCKQSLTPHITHRQRCRSSSLLTGHPSERRAGGSEGGGGEREGGIEGGREEGGGSRRAARCCAVLFGSLGSSAESVSECFRA